MAVIGSDLHWYLSASGSSAGGARSATEIVNAVDNNVLADVSDASRIAGGTQVRKIFLRNANAVDSYLPHSIWITTQPVAAVASIGLGFDDADDASSAGGVLVAFTAGAKVALVSDAADTRSVDIFGLVGGTPTKETVVLNGTSEVLSVATFDTGGPFALHTTISASRTVTVKQGTGGTARGTIAIGIVNCFRWLSAASKSAGLQVPATATGISDGIWERVVYAPAAAAGAQVLPLATEAL